MKQTHKRFFTDSSELSLQLSNSEYAHSCTCDLKKYFASQSPAVYGFVFTIHDCCVVKFTCDHDLHIWIGGCFLAYRVVSMAVFVWASAPATKQGGVLRRQAVLGTLGRPRRPSFLVGMTFRENLDAACSESA